MKIRNGFVSNSSSSSFILFKTYLSKDQINCIKKWKTYALSDEYKAKVNEYNQQNQHPEHISERYRRWLKDENFLKWIENDSKEKIEERRNRYKECAEEIPDFSPQDFPYYPEGWRVEETSDIFNIHTSMDDFDFIHYLKVNGIDIEKCGIELLCEHSYTVGLNDAKTDLKEYLNNENYWEDYYKFFEKSKFYKENIRR